MRTVCSVVLLAVLLPALPLYAQQTATLNGYVSDAESGETLISANVGIGEGTKGSSSNTSGYYSITGIEPGTHTVIATYIGYRRFEREVTFAEGEKVRLDIEMEPETLQLDQLVVESEEEKEEQKDLGVSQLEIQTIKKVPSVFQADVFRALQLVPGVKSASDFSSGLYIRGGSPDQTLILLDRTVVYNPTHFFGFFSTFNPDAVKDVRLYKGGYPARYGGRLGSVLTVFNKDGNRMETEGSVTLGLLSSRLSLEGPLKKGSWMVAARRSTLEPLLAGLRQVEENIPSRFWFLDLNGKINYDPDPDNRLSLAFYSGADNLSFPFADDAGIRLNYGNQTLSGTWTHLFSDRIFANFTVTGSRYFNFPSFEIAATPFKRSNNIWDFSVKGDLEYLASDRHDLSAGLWSGIKTLKVRDSFDGTETFSSRIQAPYHSFYLQDTWTPSERWEVTGGIRLNGFAEGGYWRLSPRLSAEYQPSDRIRLQGAYGRYHQFLTLISNEAFTGFDTWLTTDDGVPPAWGDQFVAGVKTIPREGWGLDAEVYYRTMKDLFELDPFLPDIAGLEYEEIFRFGEGYAWGAELLLEKRVGRLTGFLGYTFSVTRRKFPGFNEPLTGGEGARFYPPKFDRRHDLNLVLSYRLGSRWEATASFNYATGQAYTEPLGRTLAVDFPTSSANLDQLVVGRVNASRLPSYHRLDLSFSRSGTFFGLGEAQWQFQLINAYSRRNVWFYNFNFEENPVERSEVPLLPILPSVSYTVNF
ncbi:MAG: TonB-dependent receptor [Balneolaceae bacterium]|nr:TonB-dependent receptor [Balneolaceae bacterium]